MLLKHTVELFVFASFLLTTALAQQDSAAYRTANAFTSSFEKTKALEQFVNQFPDSKLKTRAYDGLFDLYIEQGNEAGAIGAASKSLQSVTGDNRMNPYNRFAYALAQKSFGLDSSLVWILRAEEIAERIGSRSLSGFQDTRAYVLYRQKKYVEAEELQRIAIKGNEDDPEFLSHLAMYEKENGKLNDALKTMAKALYLGGEQEAKEMFLEWIASAEKDGAKQDELKKSIVMSTIRSFVDTLKGEKLVAARSSAAILMADLKVDLPLAKQWADAAIKTLDKTSSINFVVQYRQSLGYVLAASGNNKGALAELSAIEELVDPYDARYWLALGKAHEQLGDRRKAIGSYMNGILVRNDKQIRSALESVYAKENGSLANLNTSLDSAKNAAVNFEAGSYGKSTTPSGRVILAELFTGAECGPCVASDLAFDRLIEHYPRSAVAILEYHVHVPGPDPMTTHASWERYEWYGGEGTPTVLIDGKEKMVGGGSRYAARNRFGVYRYAIQKVESERPEASLSMAVKKLADNVTVDVKVNRAKSSKNRIALHLALIERSVDYTGANGISKHAFVVRRMLDGPSGTTLSNKKLSETVTRTVSIAEIEKSIKDYLDNPTKQPSWTTRRAFNGWKARPEILNRSNLALIAWVQDMNSKAVLQSVYQDIPMTMGAK